MEPDSIILGVALFFTVLAFDLIYQRHSCFLPLYSLLLDVTTCGFGLLASETSGKTRLYRRKTRGCASDEIMPHPKHSPTGNRPGGGGVPGFLQTQGDHGAGLLLSPAEDAQNKDKARTKKNNKKNEYHEFNAFKYQRTRYFAGTDRAGAKRVIYTDNECFF